MSEIFKSQQELVGTYQSYSTIWGTRSKVVISHEGMHFAHVNSDNDYDKESTAKLTKPNIQYDSVAFSTKEKSDTIKSSSEKISDDGIMMHKTDRLVQPKNIIDDAKKVSTVSSQSHSHTPSFINYNIDNVSKDRSVNQSKISNRNNKRRYSTPIKNDHADDETWGEPKTKIAKGSFTHSLENECNILDISNIDGSKTVHSEMLFSSLSATKCTTSLQSFMDLFHDSGSPPKKMLIGYDFQSLVLGQLLWRIGYNPAYREYHISSEVYSAKGFDDIVLSNNASSIPNII